MSNENSNSSKPNPNPKWWNSIKGIAVRFKNYQISTGLIDSEIKTGKPLANRINEAFSCVTQHMLSLQPSGQVNHSESVAKLTHY